MASLSVSNTHFTLLFGQKPESVQYVHEQLLCYCSLTHVSQTVFVGMTVFVLLLGAILRLPIWGDPADDNCFNDEVYWEVRDLKGRNRNSVIQDQEHTISLFLTRISAYKWPIAWLLFLFESHFVFHYLIAHRFLKMKRASLP